MCYVIFLYQHTQIPTGCQAELLKDLRRAIARFFQIHHHFRG